MARVTVEDCLDNVDNRFSLVLAASKRARQLAMGHEPRVPWDDDKPTVVALREIAEGKIDPKTIGKQSAQPAPSLSDDHDQGEIEIVIGGADRGGSVNQESL